MMILSGDPPRGRALPTLVVVVVLALALAPFLFPGAKPLNVAAKICVYALLAASYDLLLGYAGIVSFAHVMFFGIGSYGVAIALYGLGPSWGALALGLAAALAVSPALALAIGLFSLRVQTIFFAMVTLAVASAFDVLASQLSAMTGGEDGRSFRVPRDSAAGVQAGRTASFRRRLHRPDAQLLSRLLRRRGAVPGAAAHRQFAVRPRAAGDPRKPVSRRGARLPHRLPSHAGDLLAAAGATFAGALNALWLRYTGPDTAWPFRSRSTCSSSSSSAAWARSMARSSARRCLCGAELSAGPAGRAFDGGERRRPAAAARLFHPDRWLLWLGLMFVLVVYFAPAGLAGAIRRKRRMRSRWAKPGAPASPCEVTRRLPHRLDPGLGPKAKGRQS